MRRLVWMVFLAGCTCGAPTVAPPSTTSPTPTPEATPTPAPEVREATAPEPAAPTAVQAIGWRRRMQEARRLAHAGQGVEAFAIFTALIHERPSARGLRCEAGFVAFRAALLDDAEREITRALDGWPTPPPARERGPLAMCLYNRGLIAEARHDAATAGDVFRRSLALRPNATVQAHLDALGASGASGASVVSVAEPRDEEDEDEDDPYADGVFTFDEWLAEQREEGLIREDDALETTPLEESSTSTYRFRIVETVSPSRDDEPEFFEQRLVMTTPTDTVELTSVGFERYFSWYDDHASIENVRLVEGPPELGAIVAAVTGSWGRHDAPEGSRSGVEETGGDNTLFLCAERREWLCAEVALASTETSTCNLCDAGDGTDEEEEASDAEPYIPYVRGYALTWEVDGADLVLGLNPNVEITDPEPSPRIGRVPLATLFPEPR
jgi:hypothetical protein